jgi:hypothetical protein
MNDNVIKLENEIRTSLRNRGEFPRSIKEKSILEFIRLVPNTDLIHKKPRTFDFSTMYTCLPHQKTLLIFASQSKKLPISNGRLLVLLLSYLTTMIYLHLRKLTVF